MVGAELVAGAPATTSGYMVMLAHQLFAAPHVCEKVSNCEATGAAKDFAPRSSIRERVVFDACATAV
jgi:hypothetical protein